MKIEVYSPTIRRKEMDAVLTAMVEDKIGPGEQARLLIQIAREKLGFEYCIAIRSPAIALFLALRSLGLEEGQGLVISALSPRYYLNVLKDLRLNALYADVYPGSAGITSPCISRESIEKAINSKQGNFDIRAIVLHHTLGYLPDSAAIAELGLPIIEDRSQSYGSTEAGIPAENPLNSSSGSATSLTVLGLEERDLLTAGGGALLYANSRKDASILRNLDELPQEYGLPDMNAAMGVVQFKEAKKNLERRREIAGIYTQAALRTRHGRFVEKDPIVSDGLTENQGDSEQSSADMTGGGYNNYAFPLILKTGMKDVKTYARRKEIIVESAFDNTLIGSGLVPSGLCPEAYSLSLRTVLFPLYPRLGHEEIERVSKLIATLP